ncbi:hypothetical protein CVV67_18425 [Arthrobacter stackebrandtii]|nr:hypothetical protein CVV67_18425 [Arthrobacter stackebrandtii]
MNTVLARHGTTYYFRHRSCELEGHLVSEGMLVMAGSSARKDPRPGAPETIIHRRSRLLLDGTAKIEFNRLVLAQNHLFATPSLAVDLMNGGHVREPLKLWRDANGGTLQDILGTE